MTELTRRIWVLGVLLALVPATASARVVINEVFYHAPNNIEDLEYVELHNSGDESIDLSGWAFTKGIKFKFAPGTRIDAKGFLVLCRNRDRFKEFYGTPVAGVFNQHLRNSGEQLQLSDASGRVVDSVKYQDTPPWPTGADGHSGSLERICPEEGGESVANWASSPLSADRSKPAGTPGKVNANFSAILPPIISKVKFTPENPLPDQPLTVEADVRDEEGVGEVNLLYRLAGPGFEKPESSMPMKKNSEGRYSAAIPGQAKDQLIRFRIQATGTSGARRFFPAETDSRPALSSYVHESVEPAKIPFGWIIDTTEPEFRAGQQRASSPGFRGFNPRMFGRGGGGGPPGPGGFGPGGFGPDELNRVQARMILERGLDLPSAWFELTVHQLADVATVQKLKAVFAAKLSERGKLIDDVLESTKIQEKLNALPDIIKTFQVSVAESAKPFLNDDQSKAFAEWLTKQQQPNAARTGRLFGNPNAIVNNWVKLEGAWFAVTMSAEIDEARFGELRKTFQELDKERNELAKEAANLRDLQDGLRELRERGDALDQKLVTQLKSILSVVQEKQFADWQRDRNNAGGGPGALAAGPGPGPFGGGPGEFGGRRGGFGGGPGGFRGGGPGGFGGGRGGFRGGPGGFRAPAASMASGRSAFVYFDPAKGNVELFDFVEVVPRSGGQKVHFHKDKPLNKMTTINLIFESESAVLVEPLAYEVYRRVGVAAEQSYHVRLWIDGQAAGFHLLVEQPNSAFLRRNKISDDGNLYKILWYESGVIGQHEKKTHVRAGHDDIVKLIDALEKTIGDEQWQIIKKNFAVEEVVNYFAASMALSNWDGFFNNYFTYHDVKGSGKWTMYPWDEDQTWGIVGMMGRGQVFYTMPITFGMNGDVPPGQPRGAGPSRGFGFGGGAGWWRQPGWFSGPLLANPQFRKLFLARTKEILETIYTEEVFVPIIDAMGERLKPEVKIRAELSRQEPERAIQNFEASLQGLRDHVKKRREFLLAQDEVKNAGKFSRADFETAKLDASSAPKTKSKKKNQSIEKVP